MQSIHDPLTGVFNRRLFEGRLKEEERRAARHYRPLSLLMLDVDDFKRYNDVLALFGGERIVVP